jgi:predicted dithiol-disulfide oxidoreductase (DUF899 family)
VNPCRILFRDETPPKSVTFVTHGSAPPKLIFDLPTAQRKEIDVATHTVVSKDDWLEARRRLLAREKEFTRMRDQLSAERRALPWTRMDKQYCFDGSNGRETLSQLFGDRSQLIVYHFMFAPEWETGCKSCSFWADNFNGITAHLRARDVAFVAVSRAPLAKLQAFAKRLGWTFKWVSSNTSDFNYDLEVSFKPDVLARGGARYNFAELSSFQSRGSELKDFAPSEMPGISVFAKDENGTVFRTYSTYGRGLDMMNTAYHYLDLAPKGRDEAGLPHTMSWVKLRDLYDR